MVNKSSIVWNRRGENLAKGKIVLCYCLWLVLHRVKSLEVFYGNTKKRFKLLFHLEKRNFLLKNVKCFNTKFFKGLFKKHSQRINARKATNFPQSSAALILFKIYFIFNLSFPEKSGNSSLVQKLVYEINLKSYPISALFTKQLLNLAILSNKMNLMDLLCKNLSTLTWKCHFLMVHGKQVQIHLIRLYGQIE